MSSAVFSILGVLACIFVVSKIKNMFESEKSLDKIPPGFEKIESVVLPKEQVAIVKEWAKKAKAIAVWVYRRRVKSPREQGVGLLPLKLLTILLDNFVEIAHQPLFSSNFMNCSFFIQLNCSSQ